VSLTALNPLSSGIAEELAGQCSTGSWTVYTISGLFGLSVDYLDHGFVSLLDDLYVPHLFMCSVCHMTSVCVNLYVTESVNLYVTERAHN